MVKKYRVSLTGEEWEEVKGLVSRGRAAAYEVEHPLRVPVFAWRGNAAELFPLLAGVVLGEFPPRSRRRPASC